MSRMHDQPNATPAGAKTPSLTHAKHVINGVVLAAIIVTVAVLGYRQAAFAQGTVTIGDKIDVRVSVASNDRTRERGLSGKKGLAADEGMLFLFDHRDTFGFWMKDMRFPIDILWINDGVIADLSVDVPMPVPGERLPLYFPRVPVNTVLEVPAGFAKRHGLKVGMPVDMRVDSRRGLR
jgi:uncharacterized membrane protein (UPF0127 family)